MSHRRNTDLLRIALDLGFINLEQFNRVMEIWEKDPTRDAGIILREQELVSENDYKSILSEAGLSEAYTDGFALRGILGGGGVGRVFLGYDNGIKREVAIKELIAGKGGEDGGRALARFLREARISGQLEHPGIVPVYELGRKPDGTCFYVMKYVHGKTLHEVIKSYSADEDEESFRARLTLLDKVIDVCEAIAYAHSKGVIHRDLKPSNIVLGEFGETIILDWGLAKKSGEVAVDDSDAVRLSGTKDSDAVTTRQDALVGTPSYMSPEQIDSKFGAVDFQSDVYSLGVILFILLAGGKPYEGTAEEVMNLVASDNPSPSPLDFCPHVPPELAAICRRAMAKDKALRFRDASELAGELKAFRDGRIVSVYAYSRKELFKRFVSKNKTVVIATAAVIASIIAGAGFSVDFAIDAHKAKKTAERALTDVTRLSEAAMSLSRRSSGRLNDYFSNLVFEMDQISKSPMFSKLIQSGLASPYLEKLYRRFPAVEGIIAMNQDGSSFSVPREVSAGKGLIGPNYVDIAKKIEEDGSFISGDYESDGGYYAFVIHVPIYHYSEMKGVLMAVVRMDRIISSVLDFDPAKSEYQVWCMEDDGRILFDEDKRQVGLYLFADSMYAKYPELLAFGERIRREPWGLGHYSFLGRDGAHVVHKVAAWDTFEPVDGIGWKFVTTHPYLAK